MAIDVVPQPRIDHLVTGLDGSTRRRTDHRGIAWYGGRQEPRTSGMVTVQHQWAGVVSPFWLPDTLAYRTDRVHEIVVSIAASVLFVPDTSALAHVSAQLVVNEAHPDVSHVLVHVTGSARVPVGVSYDVTVLAPPDAVVG